MQPRKRIDVGWSDLAFALGQVFLPRRRRPLQDAVERRLPGDDAVVCLSVRSGFDLLLASLQWPPGDEILFSALTIADMPRIATAHGLVAVPVDLDAETMLPSVAALDRAASARTRAVVVAPLFGARPDLTAIVEWAEARGVLVFEDRAQAWHGSDDDGHHAGDAVFFSFGGIKTATALGGALIRIRDDRLRQSVRDREAAYPVAGRLAYAAKIAKYALLKLLGYPIAYGLFVAACRLLQCDDDAWVTRMTRGFSGAGFFERIRRRPPTPLLALLDRRLRRFDLRRIAERTRKGRLLQSLLEPRVACVGAANERHSFWAFPIAVADPMRTIAALRTAGFDAARTHSLSCVTDGRPDVENELPEVTETVRHLVALPFDVAMSDAVLRRLAEVVLDAESSTVSTAAPHLDALPIDRLHSTSSSGRF